MRNKGGILGKKLGYNIMIWIWFNGLKQVDEIGKTKAQAWSWSRLLNS